VDLFRTATANAEGRFAVRGIAPGAYGVFAFERSTDSYLALDSLAVASGRVVGTPVQMIEGSRATVNLTVSQP
jgi:hypothetical protein